MRGVLTYILLLAVPAAYAGKRDFPAFDPAHAHCAIETTYPLQQCADIFDSFYSTIYDFSPDPQSGGFYTIKEQGDNDYIWATRKNAAKTMTDDVIFVFVDQHVSDTQFQCQVQARSRSQAASYFDNETNYCNMWTILRAIPTFEVVDTRQCNWVPDNARKTCALF